MTLQNENRKLNLVRCNRCGEFHATDRGCNVRSEHIAPVMHSNATTGWIKVSDRLPELCSRCNWNYLKQKNMSTAYRHIPYITYSESKGVNVGIFFKEWKKDTYAFRYMNNGSVIPDVTHWMPLPEPPKS